MSYSCGLEAGKERRRRQIGARRQLAPVFVHISERAEEEEKEGSGKRGKESGREVARGRQAGRQVSGANTSDPFPIHALSNKAFVL